MKIKILASMLAGALAMLPVTANAGWGGGGVGPYGIQSQSTVGKTILMK